MKIIVLFDGTCNFCSGSVQFIIKRDQKRLFQFASLQSDIAQSLLSKYQLPEDLDSMVVVKDNNVYTKSDAALEIARKLDGAWKFFFFLNIVPSRIRNYFYDLFAKNRHRLFKNKTSCLVPSPEVRERFL